MKPLRRFSTISLAANLIILLSLLISPSTSMAETQYFLGIEPQFNKEDWYSAGELNTNILPLVYEKPVREHIGLRLRSHLFLHTGGTAGTAISLVGLGAAWLWYMDPLSENGLHGFNIGPVAIFSYDFLDNITHSTIALETGYAFTVSNPWTLNIAMQAGRSYFSGNTFPDSDHFGIYVSFGRWY